MNAPLRNTARFEPGNTSTDISLAPLDAGTGAVLSGHGRLLDLDPDVVRKAFAASSVLLLRGFVVTREDFRAFSERLSLSFVTHLNLAREKYGDRTMTGVTPGKGHFFAHAEFGYTPFRPDLAWFYCERPADRGGETTVHDGVAVLARMKPEHRLLFERKRLLFEYVLTPDHWRELKPDLESLQTLLGTLDPSAFSFRVDAEHCVHVRYVTSGIVRTRYGGALAFCNSLLDCHTPQFEDGSAVPKAALYDFISLSEAAAVPVQWQAGDVLMVDNSRYMHGRRKFEDMRRTILVRFSNIDF